jgi:iron complex outermembrane receptor protein
MGGWHARSMTSWALLATAAIVPMMMAPAVHAQAAGERSFDIPAQPLADALVTFGIQSGMQVTTNGVPLRGVRTGGVRGNSAPAQALSQLLAGTGFTFRINGNVITLEAPPQSSDGAIQLGPVRVEGEGGSGRPAPSTSVLGTLPEEYAGGQVARGGQVGMLGNRDMMDTPFSQTSYTNKTIQNQQARTLGDVMANEASVIIGTKGGGRNDFWTFRGFSVQPYLASNSLNGLPGMAPLNYASTDYIERVEVLRGASTLLKGTAMNGMAALGGTVDLVTKRASDRPLTQLTARYISESQIGVHADVGRRFGPNNEFGIRVNGSIDGGDTPVDTQHAKFGTAAVNLDYRGNRVRVSADFAHQWSSLTAPSSTITINGLRGVLASLTEVPKAPRNSVAFSPSWAEGKHEITLGMVQAEVDILDNVTAYAAIGKQRYKATATDDDLYLLNSSGDVGILAARFRDRTDVLSLQGGVNAKINTGAVGHTLNLNLSRIKWEYDSTPLSRAGAGAGAIIPVGTLSNPVFPSTPVYPPDEDILPAIHNRSSSIAIADTMSFMDERILFTAGVRYNEIEASSFQFSGTNIQSTTYKSSAWSPSFALVLKPSANVSLYANYIQALEVGSVVGNSYANAGEIFPPYASKQYEAGVKVDWGSVTTTVAAFQIAQPDALSVDDPAGGLPTLTLDGEQRNRGIELTAYGALADSVRLLGGVTLIEATQTKNDGGRNGWRAANTPKFRAVVGGEWDTPFIEGLTLTGRLTHTGNVVALNRRPDLKLPAWTQVDLGARYSLAGPWSDKPITFRFDVDNVFDASYWKSPHPSAGNLMRSDPRTFRLSATVDF